MIGLWERNVPVFDIPIRSRVVYVLTAMFVLAFGLVTYRELAGLGPVSGMNDAYAWGIWKTFNVMTLTGLGSGAFAVGMALSNTQILPPTVTRAATLSSIASSRSARGWRCVQAMSHAAQPVFGAISSSGVLATCASPAALNATDDSFSLCADCADMWPVRVSLGLV